jgi:hypothetical protein
MSQIEIFIDPNSPSHGELEEGLRKSLGELTSVSVTEERKSVPPGTLGPGLEHAVAFVIQHQDKVLPLATAVLNVLSNLLRFRSAKSQKGEKKDKPVVIVVKEERLSLPATEATQKKFLRRIQTDGQSPTKVNRPRHRSSSSAKKTKPTGKRRK